MSNNSENVVALKLRRNPEVEESLRDLLRGLDMSQDKDILSSMSNITREEMTARFEASEARVEARLAGIDAKLDTLLTKSDLALNAARHAETSARDAQRAASATKWNIAATGLAVTAVIAAIAGLWMSALSTVGTLSGL